MKRDELAEAIWSEAPIAKRVIGRERFGRAFDAAVETAPIYQICYGSSIAAGYDIKAHTRTNWRRRVEEHRNCQFGPLTWIVVGSVINFLIFRLLEWATQNRANAVMLAGWSAESSWKVQ